MPLGMEVGLGTGDFVLDGDPDPLSKRLQPKRIFDRFGHFYRAH